MSSLYGLNLQTFHPKFIVFMLHLNEKEQLKSEIKLLLGILVLIGKYLFQLFFNLIHHLPKNSLIGSDSRSILVAYLWGALNPSRGEKIHEKLQCPWISTPNLAVFSFLNQVNVFFTIFSYFSGVFLWKNQIFPRNFPKQVVQEIFRARFIHYIQDTILSQCCIGDSFFIHFWTWQSLLLW